MYCNSCGKSNPDGSAFCSSCGKSLCPTPDEQPIMESNDKQKEPVSRKEYKKYFWQSWRLFVTKPFGLVLLICYSVSIILSAIETNNLFSTVGFGLDILSELPSLKSSAMENSPIILLLMQLCAISPGALSAIGFWMLYADAWDRSDRPINTKGFEWIRRAYTIAIAVGCLGAIICLFMYFSAMHKMNGYSDHIASGLKNGLTSSLLLVIILAVATALIYDTFIKLLDTIRSSVENCNPDFSFIKGTIIIEFVYGSLVLVDMVIREITVGGLAVCAIPFLFGIWLLQYSDFLAVLNEEYVGDDSGKNPWTDKKYIPTWKRIEMQKQKPENTECNEQQNFDEKSIPAWKRVQMEKENREE